MSYNRCLKQYRIPTKGLNYFVCRSLIRMMAENDSREQSTSCENSSELYSLVGYIKRYYLPVMYGIISIVGLVGNVTAITIYLVKIRPFNSSIIIMLNLAMADLLYVLSLPFLVHFYTTGDWVLGKFMCSLVRYSFHFNLYGSILLLTCLSVFRYVVVVYPLKAAQVNRQSWGIISCLTVWLICLIGMIPMFSLIATEERCNKTICLDFASNNPEYTSLYCWILTIFGFLVPLFVVCLCYTRVARVLSQGLLAHRSSQFRARRMTVLILVVFVVCFTPYHLLRLARVDTRVASVSFAVQEIVHTAYIISRPLAGLNTFFNLALYTLAGDRFQQAFWSLFRWRVSLPQNMVETVYRPRGLSFNNLLPKPELGLCWRQGKPQTMPARSPPADYF